MSSVANNLQSVWHQIAQSCDKAGRSQSEITLLAVSKTKPVSAIQQAYTAGQRDFAENYLQEALEKMALTHELDICWHFIGPLQSNKTRAVAEKFDWVHTLDRARVADRLSAQRPSESRPLQVCIQVNIDRQDSKSGCLPEDCQALAKYVASLPNLRLRGLMAIPSPANSRHAFAQLRQLRDEIMKKTGIVLDTLSMGMSADLPVAISEGATIVRVGTAIFGQRDSSSN